jgi:hypothetical protein
VDQSNIVVAQPSEPQPPDRPRGVLIGGVGIVVLVSLLSLGRIGEPPATGDVAVSTSLAELTSIPSTAATTLGTTTTTEPVLVLPATPESIEEALAAPAAWTFDRELVVPDAMPIVSHVAAGTDAIFLFGPTSPVGEFASGLQVIAWDGASFVSPVAVAPPAEAALDVAGGPLGLIAATARTALAPELFGPSSMEPVTIRTSRDGRDWAEVILGDPDAYLHVLGMAVGDEEAWVLGAPRADMFDDLVAALPSGIGELVAAGHLVPVADGTSRVSLYIGGGFTPVASYGLEELGLDPPFNLTFAANVAFRSTDLTQWEEAGIPLEVRALTTDADGVVYAYGSSGVWRAAGDGSWDLVTLAGDLGGGAYDLAVHDDAVFGWYPSRGGVEVVRTGPDMEIRRYALGASGFSATDPVGGELAVLFPFSSISQPPGEIVFAPADDGSQIVANFDLGQYQVRDPAGGVLHTAEIFDDPDDKTGFDAETASVTFESDEGLIVGSVPLEDVRQAFLTALSTLDGARTTLFVTDGDSWMATDKFGTSGSVGPVADAASVYLGFVVVEGPFRGSFPTQRESRVFLGLRAG